jgi:hypothetical protein
MTPANPSSTGPEKEENEKTNPILTHPSASSLSGPAQPAATLRGFEKTNPNSPSVYAPEKNEPNAES